MQNDLKKMEGQTSVLQECGAASFFKRRHDVAAINLSNFDNALVGHLSATSSNPKSCWRDMQCPEFAKQMKLACISDDARNFRTCSARRTSSRVLLHHSSIEEHRTCLRALVGSIVHADRENSKPNATLERKTGRQMFPLHSSSSQVQSSYLGPDQIERTRWIIERSLTYHPSGR